MEFFRFRRDIPFMRFALTFNVISLVTFVLAVGFLADGMPRPVDKFPGETGFFHDVPAGVIHLPAVAGLSL